MFTFTAPRHTVEDEQLERDTLTKVELHAIHEDIYGRPKPLTWEDPVDIESKVENNGSIDIYHEIGSIQDDHAEGKNHEEFHRYSLQDQLQQQLQQLQQEQQQQQLRLIELVHDYITSEIPVTDKAPYLEAVSLAPNLVSKESPTDLFLYWAQQRQRSITHHDTNRDSECYGDNHDDDDCNNQDLLQQQERQIVQLAARQMIMYWKLRYEFFHGATQALLPMTIVPGGAMYPYVAQLERGFVFPLPTPDRAGRTVLYHDRIRSGQCESPKEVISCCSFYMYHVITRDQYRHHLENLKPRQQNKQSNRHNYTTQQQGFVIFANMRVSAHY
jgi:hypothetical protein